MKYIKTYEDINEPRIGDHDVKKYIVTDFGDGDCYLDEILKVEGNKLKIKNLYAYDLQYDEVVTINIDWEHIDYLEDVDFMSDDYDEAKEYFDNIVNRYRDTKKYNL